MENDKLTTPGAQQQTGTSSRTRQLLPLILATMASQAVLVVLTPTIVEVGREFGASVGAVGQARSLLAGAAIASSLAIAPFLDRLGIRPLLLWGAALAVAGSVGASLSPSLLVFLSVHALIGVSFACLLSAGFAGVATFPKEARAWAMGHVVGANALAWILVSPFAGLLTDTLSWRVAHAVPAVIALSALVSARVAPGGSATGAPDVGRGLRGVFAEPSARRWIVAELIAFFAWGTYLTFIGAFFIQRYGLGESAAGILLALGAAVFFLSSIRSSSLARRFPQRELIAVTALGTGAFIILQLNAEPALWISVVLLCIVAFCAGVRTPVSSTLGLSQLPQQPGLMMAARTAALQIGYLLGGLVGGVTLVWSGYAALGLVLGTAMTLTAALILRVSDPLKPEIVEPTVAAASKDRS
ncbi:MAG: MFS transporter [Rubrobacteraceae bacterium]